METVAAIRKTIMEFAPVQTVASEQGRGDDATDPDGSFLAEFFVPLKPQDEWPKGLTKIQLVDQMNEKLNSRVHRHRFQLLAVHPGQHRGGRVRREGRELGQAVRPRSRRARAAVEIAQGRARQGARASSIPAAFNLLGQPNLNVRIDRAKAARYGFSVGDINTIVQAAIGGQEVTRVYEGEINSGLTVRLAPRYRDNIDAIRSIPIALAEPDPKGVPAYIALSDVADVRLETGAAYIYRENSQRFIPLKYSVRERDLGSTVAEAQERIAKNVPLPQGYRMEWSGEFGALQDAKKRLAVIVPLSLILIIALLYSLFNSVRDSLIALSGIPFAVCGGILGLYVAGLNLSVSAAVGFISLFGVAAMDGILLVSYIRRDLEEGMGTETAIIQAGEARMRQVFMTGFSACIGLVPAALSTGIGSQVQQPLACVIVGGMLLSPICSLLVIPTVARLFMPRGRRHRERGRGPSRTRRRPQLSFRARGELSLPLMGRAARAEASRAQVGWGLVHASVNGTALASSCKSP